MFKWLYCEIVVREFEPQSSYYVNYYVLRTSIDKMKDIGFKLAKERSRRYSARTIADADYAVDIALLENTPAQADFLLHSLERSV